METKVIGATVWPHNHKDEFKGPHDLRIGVSYQPPLLRGWNPKDRPSLLITQPTPETTNLTVIRIHFSKKKEEEPAGTRHPSIWFFTSMPCPDVSPDRTAEEAAAFREAWKKAHPGTLNVYLKGRWTDSLAHPIPCGRYEGSVQYTDDEATFTLQATTLAVQNVAKKSSLILPGDEEFEAYRRI